MWIPSFISICHQSPLLLEKEITRGHTETHWHSPADMMTPICVSFVYFAFNAAVWTAEFIWRWMKWGDECELCFGKDLSESSGKLFYGNIPASVWTYWGELRETYSGLPVNKFEIRTGDVLNKRQSVKSLHNHFLRFNRSFMTQALYGAKITVRYAAWSFSCV